MPIFVQDDKKQFHLQGKDVSYIFSVLPNGELGHMYFGKKISHRKDFSHLLQLPKEPLGNATFAFEGDSTFSLEFVKREYPSYGTGDYREPAFHFVYEDGSRVTRLQYDHFKRLNGKPSLQGLPAVYVEDENEAETLIITMRDPYTNVCVELSYTVYARYNAIIRSARITNEGKKPLIMDRALSASVDFPHANFDWIHLDGAWIKERHIACDRLSKGFQSVNSKRGVSSSLHNPFIALKERDANEHRGIVYGFSLVYSGNFLAGVEVDHYDMARVLMGINPFDFSWKLEEKESFQTPEVVMVFSDEGLNGMSQTYHELYVNRLVRGKWRQSERPILINNWEATYFNFTESKLMEIVEEASKLGIELFALDDGWFEGRHNDTTSLGDWIADKTKLPEGVKGFGQKVEQNGLQFGIWVEPEMISKKSMLFEKHPDWVLGVQTGPLSHGRNQYMLDLTKEPVQSFIIDTLSQLLSDAPIRYVKWDMNRNMSEIGTDYLDATRQGEVAHRYVLGLYAVLDELTKRFPNVLFESCASGGNRFDPGMLYYMPQTWTSDNTDAIERLKIQYGTSLVYPLSTMGAHVSAVPNHQTRRITPLETRFHVAMFGVFGYELDVTKLPAEEKAKVKNQVAFYKENRKLIQFGRFYRILSPFEQNDTAWMVVSPDRQEAIVAFYRTLAKPNPGLVQLKLVGLDESKFYRVEELNAVYKGDELMHAGITLPAIYNGTVYSDSSFLAGDFQSVVWKLSVVEEGS